MLAVVRGRGGGATRARRGEASSALVIACYSSAVRQCVVVQVAGHGAMKSTAGIKFDIFCWPRLSNPR